MKLAVAMTLRLLSGAALALTDAYGLHSMVYSNAPSGFKDAMFREAAAVGARDIRADLAFTQVILGTRGERDWAAVDEYVVLARRYELNLTLVLLATPVWAADCPSPAAAAESYKCAPSDPAQFGQWAGEIARRTKGTISHFEILNEPDHPDGYYGTPVQYARTLVASYKAIKAANPRARVLLGGIHKPIGDGWIGRALRVPGAARSFDVANVHIRGGLRSVARQTRRWKAFFAAYGFTGPLWVTEHGYPSDTAYQTDSRFTGGERAQARYLRASLPAIVRAGAGKVFVSLRDNLSGAFASEGVLGGTVADPPSANPHIIRKRSFYALRAMIAERRGRDSNPRSACTDSGFQDRCIRPLCHPSGPSMMTARRPWRAGDRTCSTASRSSGSTSVRRCCGCGTAVKGRRCSSFTGIRGPM